MKRPTFLHQIETQKKYFEFAKGESIYEEENYRAGNYFIKKGKVKISLMGADGKEQIIRLLNKGDILGYRSLLNGGNYKSGG